MQRDVKRNMVRVKDSGSTDDIRIETIGDDDAEGHLDILPSHADSDIRH